MRNNIRVVATAKLATFAAAEPADDGKGRA